MGQNKEELKKLLAFISALTEQPGNEEFVAGLRALLFSGTPSIEKAKLEEIYEYCIERNSRNQAKGFYSSFPIIELIPELEIDYVLMESFKRRGDFLNYSAHVFKQIEGISSWICNDEVYKLLFQELYNAPSLIKYEKNNSKPYTARKQDSESIGKLLFGDFSQNKDGKDKKDIPLNKQYIVDKVKAALYFGGYATCMYSVREFASIAYTILGLYLVRCEADHSGTVRTEKQEAIFQSVIAEREKYFATYFSLLCNFVTKITDGYQFRNQLLEYIQREDSGVVTSVLPSMIFVRICDRQPISICNTLYDKSIKFEIGAEVRVIIVGDKIIRVEK